MIATFINYNSLGTRINDSVYSPTTNWTLGMSSSHGTYSNVEPPFPNNVNIDENTWNIQRVSGNIDHDRYHIYNTETSAPFIGNGPIAGDGSNLIIMPDITYDTTGTTGIAYVHMYIEKNGTIKYFKTEDNGFGHSDWCYLRCLPLNSGETPQTFLITNVELSSTIANGGSSS
jgi:hypothetical protein